MDREHELPLGVVLEAERCKLEILARVTVKEVDNPSAVYGIPGKPVGMPRKNAICFASLYASSILLKIRRPGAFALCDSLRISTNSTSGLPENARSSSV